MTSTKAVGIVRVSQIDDDAQSPETQVALIVKHCLDKGYDLDPKDIFNENDAVGDGKLRNVSGAAKLTNRPGLGPAVAMVERGTHQVIVGGDFHRLFRDLDVQREVIKRVEDAGGVLDAIDMGPISNATAASEFTANIYGAVGQYVRKVSREKSIAAVTQAIEQGKVPWSQTDPGYLRNEDGTLRPDPKLKPVIVKAFRMRAEKHTIADVRSYLAMHGIDRSYHGVQCLLRSRVYLGEIHFGERQNLYAHKAIIERDLWDTVQRTTVSRGRRAASDRLLARLGVLRCATCGSKMVVASSNNGGYRIYRCPPTGDCGARVTISAEMVEAAVETRVKELVAGFKGTATADVDLEALRESWQRAETALDGFIDTFDGLEDRPATKRRRAELEDACAQHLQRYKQAEDAKEAASVVIDDYDSLDLSERRDVIRRVLDRVTVAPGRGPDRIVIDPKRLA